MLSETIQNTLFEYINNLKQNIFGCTQLAFVAIRVERPAFSDEENQLAKTSKHIVVVVAIVVVVNSSSL